MISKSQRYVPNPNSSYGIIIGIQLEYFYLNLEIYRIIYDAVISFEAN